MAKETITDSPARHAAGTTLKDRMESLVREMVEGGILFEDAVEEFEKHFILAVLKRTNGNVSKASEALRIHRNTLSKRVEKYFENGHMAGGRYRRPRPATATARKAAPAKKAGRARR